MNGKVTAIDASQYNITAGPAVPLDSISKHDQPSDRIRRSTDTREATLVNVENYDWENRVTNVKLTGEGALQQSM